MCTSPRLNFSNPETKKCQMTLGFDSQLMSFIMVGPPFTMFLNQYCFDPVKQGWLNISVLLLMTNYTKQRNEKWSYWHISHWWFSRSVSPLLRLGQQDYGDSFLGCTQYNSLQLPSNEKTIRNYGILLNLFKEPVDNVLLSRPCTNMHTCYCER